MAIAQKSLNPTDGSVVFRPASKAHRDGFSIHGVGHIKIVRFSPLSLSSPNQYHQATLTISNLTDRGKEALTSLGFEVQRDGTYKGNMCKAINMPLPVSASRTLRGLQSELMVHVPPIALKLKAPGFGKLGCQ